MLYATCHCNNKAGYTYSICFLSGGFNSSGGYIYLFLYIVHSYQYTFILKWRCWNVSKNVTNDVILLYCDWLYLVIFSCIWHILIGRFMLYISICFNLVIKVLVLLYSRNTYIFYSNNFNLLSL